MMFLFNVYILGGYFKHFGHHVGHIQCEGVIHIQKEFQDCASIDDLHNK